MKHHPDCGKQEQPPPNPLAAPESPKAKESKHALPVAGRSRPPTRGPCHRNPQQQGPHSPRCCTPHPPHQSSSRAISTKQSYGVPSVGSHIGSEKSAPGRTVTVTVTFERSSCGHSFGQCGAGSEPAQLVALGFPVCVVCSLPRASTIGPWWWRWATGSGRGSFSGSSCARVVLCCRLFVQQCRRVCGLRWCQRLFHPGAWC
jgi:hypothetical protein